MRDQRYPADSPPGPAVPGFEDYVVSEDGVVFTRGKHAREYGTNHPWRPLYSWVNKHGYVRVRLVKGGKKYYRSVHSLVLLTHVGPRPHGLVTRHLNGVKTDNRLANLSYATQKENVADKERHGTWQRGSRHGNAKLTETQVEEILTSALAGEGGPSLAVRFGIDVSTVQCICVGKIWRHVRPDLLRPIRLKRPRKQAA